MHWQFGALGESCCHSSGVCRDSLLLKTLTSRNESARAVHYSTAHPPVALSIQRERERERERGERETRERGERERERERERETRLFVARSRLCHGSRYGAAITTRE